MTSLKRGIKVRSVVGTMMWLGLSIGILLMIGWCIAKMNLPLSRLPTQGYLDTTGGKDYLTMSHLVAAALRTTTRLFIGMGYSILFSLIFGILAARYRSARYVILPIVNLLESVPLLGFLTFTTAWFMGLFPNNVLGVEAVAIFGVFTAQAWNIMLALYQSLRVTPEDLMTVAKQFGCNSWQRFWRLEFLYATPSILWNIVISQSAAWFALVACEQATIVVPKNETLVLPGIGSYIQIALDTANFGAVINAVIALVICVLLVNVFIFQPLIKGTAHYKYGTSTDSQLPQQSQVYDLMVMAKAPLLVKRLHRHIRYWWLYGAPKQWQKLGFSRIIRILKKYTVYWRIAWWLVIAVGLYRLGVLLIKYLDWINLSVLFKWTFLTTSRVLIAVLLSALIFIPLAVWVASNARRLKLIQPVGQVLGSIPADIYIPIVALMITLTGTTQHWWVIPLIMTGTQWYFFSTLSRGIWQFPVISKMLLIFFTCQSGVGGHTF
ncbi:ABC transporter permease subunit [Lactiplantibacillus plantarum]|uniref:ABC transporter permease subunit n=1 Tax=Lactiplantibacillus plantarum TaxID=1590 RepID=UPI000E28CF79|nr:ABC transporter permease subunit [Lactiplantibacillus plantarum]BBA83317.1 nitrate/sulfonate/bicarbonate ABC transporter, permease protein [Lactiplantibacillus plantarum]